MIKMGIGKVHSNNGNNEMQVKIRGVQIYNMEEDNGNMIL